MSSKSFFSRKSSFPKKSSALQFSNSYRSKKLPLRAVLIVPFVLEVAIAVGLTGYLSFRNGQQAVNQLANRLMGEFSTHIAQRLDSYLDSAKRENEKNATALKIGGLNPNNLHQLGVFFWSQTQTHRFSYVNFQHVSGGSIGAGYAKGVWHIGEQSKPGAGGTDIYSVDPWGEQTYLFNLPENENPRLKEWFVAASRARQQVWTPIWISDDRPAAANIAVSTPIFDRTNRLVGVTSVALSLREIHQFLSSIRASKNATVFIVERSGLLVASSNEQPIYRTVNGTLQRLHSSDRWNSLMAAATDHLQEKFGGLEAIQTSHQLSFVRDDERQFIQVTPYRDELGLDWLVVVAVPESDFIGEIYNNTHTTIFLCAIALAGAIVLGFVTSHWIAEPILRLSDASRDLALGKLDAPVKEASLIAELDVLAHSFNQMTEHLQQSFDEVTVALQESEEKFTKVFRTSPDPIAISTLEGKFLEVNDSFVNVFGYPREEVVGRTAQEVGLWANIEDREKLAQALKQDGVMCNLEYNFYSSSGELLTLLFSSEIIELNGKACMLGVAKDITGRKQAEEALRQSEQRFRGALGHQCIGYCNYFPGRKNFAGKPFSL
ncbi:PAS domain S-box protein [Kovacikia minuta CCNUW1]|uniref:PAS domain S-box protein n=1 Tax=Kovacikia minuta TaxID=2931930 RepID=UPI001CCFEFC0|nr:PAS domain S-box protein [Kovacikia minuta]UBF25500.1 PAS domain S-box protein [Kovacikia minuta CCNUW1]